MSISEGLLVSLFGTFMILFVVWIVDIVYFHFRYQKAIDRKVHEAQGEPYANPGLLLSLPRLGGYGMGLLFPGVARRNGFHEIVEGLPRNQRYHLIFQFVSGITAVILMVAIFILIEFFGV